ncbi:MAG: hypothetical protein ACOC5T_07395 [Elusimicrobiota bacterium]
MTEEKRNMVDLEEFLNGYQVLERTIQSKGQVYIAESSDKPVSELKGLRAKIVVLDIFEPDEKGDS